MKGGKGKASASVKGGGASVVYTTDYRLSLDPEDERYIGPQDNHQYGREPKGLAVDVVGEKPGGLGKDDVTVVRELAATKGVDTGDDAIVTEPTAGKGVEAGGDIIATEPAESLSASLGSSWEAPPSVACLSGSASSAEAPGLSGSASSAHAPSSLSSTWERAEASGVAP